eukprot:GFUD01033729.1.p1 GENE.GFUD01033729.1~~GFUD01033729.1.p1  ORF type:complete len:210 (+),score=51.88 GFUD01033729.1:74-703(+)
MMATAVLSRIVPKAIASRKKQKTHLTEETMNVLTLNTELEKEKLQTQHQNFLRNHANGQINKKSFNSMMKESYPGAKTKRINRHVFRMYDTNGDGAIDFKEYTLCLNILSNGTPEQILKQIFRMLDINNDGKINIKELKEVVKDLFGLSKKNRPDSIENEDNLAGEAFVEMDLNEDGEISEEELVAACLAQKKFARIITLQIIELFLGN